MNLDEIAKSVGVDITRSPEEHVLYVRTLRPAMKESVRQALELAARRACLKINNGRPIQIDRESILNVINEIE